MRTQARAPLVISPELVLVDPELRARALAELELAAARRPWRPETLAGMHGEHEPVDVFEANGVTHVGSGSFGARDRGHSRSYGLWLSVLLNVVLLGLLFTRSTAEGPWLMPPEVAGSGAVQRVGAEASEIATEPFVAAGGARPRRQGAVKGVVLKSGALMRPAAKRESGSSSSVIPPKGRSPAVNAPAVQPGDSGRQAPARRGAAARLDVLRVAERRAFEFLQRSQALSQFLDPQTKLVRANVAVRCAAEPPAKVKGTDVLTCQVWQQPRQSASGVSLAYRVLENGRFSISIRRNPPRE